jgi:para-nitrobenzyl esterase
VSDVDVTIRSGRLHGLENDGVAAFLGVPYAAAPFGENRFQPPRPAPVWEGTRSAARFGAACPQLFPQPAAGDPGGGFWVPLDTGPDCLSLNVWTPDVGGSGLPVLVWIHGGGYLTGGSAMPEYDGRRFAREGIVFVSINYRLNVEGFLYFDDQPANLGLRDQIAALHWVQDNIASFGGDPGQVTIWGQSAGAVSVFGLLGAPPAAGTFRAAIAQSGSPCASATAEQATRVTTRLAELLGVPPTPADLAAVPEDQMWAGVAGMLFEFTDPGTWGDEAFMVTPFRLVIDGDVLPAPILDTIAAGRRADVAVLAGSTRDETGSFLYHIGGLEGPDSDGNYRYLDMPQQWRKAALSAFGLSEVGLARLWRGRPGPANDAELVAAAWTDFGIRIPTLRALSLHAAAGGAAYAYEFDWQLPGFVSSGSLHAIDVPFVFGNLASPVLDRARSVDGSTPAELTSLTGAMHGAWVSHTRHGDPGWRSYEPRQRAAMRFGSASRLTAVDASTLKVWSAHPLCSPTAQPAA